MPLSSLLLLLALLVLVALFVARPLFDSVSEEDNAAPDEGSQWIAERERVLDALVELDSDWHLGKVPEELYSIQRQQLLAKGAIAIKQMESVAPKKSTAKTEDDQLEKMIAVRRAKRKK